MKKNRNNCVLCTGEVSTLFAFDMPVFMGVNKNSTRGDTSTMSFKVCNACGEVQIGELLDLAVLYQSNHNIGVVGTTWKQHYVELAEFIAEAVQDKIVLEISDPSAKIAKLSKNFKHWYIVEPNPEKNEVKNVEFINGFFDEDFNKIEDVDVIVHSHLLEHIHDPNSFFQKCSKLLKENGMMIISVPDMEYLLHREYSPNNILHFEHTYYLNYQVLELLASSNEFEIIESKRYSNHSIFYKLKKNSNTTKAPLRLDVADSFKLCYRRHTDAIENITKTVQEYSNHNVYLFGAHVSSQFYLYNGLNRISIKSIIDNDTNKQEHTLYGTTLKVESPNTIVGDEKCIVICSHIGIYYEEVVKQLLQLNKNIIIL